MPRRSSSTQAAIADAAAQQDVRAAAGAPRSTPPSGAGSGDPLVAGLRRAGLLPLLVLHLLGEGPSYGNQLMERVSAVTQGIVAANPNTMYPLLRTMEADGLVAGTWEHPERRSRRFYELTERGRAERDRLAEELRPRLDALADAIGVMRNMLAGES